MNKLPTPATAIEQAEKIQHYYQWQSKIYDLTRWSFLFGRNSILSPVPLDANEAWNIMEVGCGTGFNLQNLAKRFPKAHLTGVDVSPDMLRIARQNNSPHLDRISFINAPYGPGGFHSPGQLDFILFSYALTMINPQWPSLIQQAFDDLKPGGYIAVVDFHDSRFSWFKKHMGNHHVRMDGHLLPCLSKHFQPIQSQCKAAYGGVWTYLIYVGKKAVPPID
ncbi:MAG: class I SAM-dependent methyltransferase [Saprospiraceae bacterium]